MNTVPKPADAVTDAGANGIALQEAPKQASITFTALEKAAIEADARVRSAHGGVTNPLMKLLQH